MLVAKDLMIRAGARLLVNPISFQIGNADKIGFVGRNGAGKTTTMRVLAGETLPAGGMVQRTGPIGYLPQDPRESDLTTTAKDRILSARNLDVILARMVRYEAEMATSEGEARERAMRGYAQAETEFLTAGGYAAEAESARIAANLGLPGRVLAQPLHELSGGQRRRIELARILFSDSDVLLLDEPTNHLDQDSVVWLRDFIKSYEGGVMMISHNTDLLKDTVNKVFYLDANRATMDCYSMGWSLYLDQRAADEKRRKKERAAAQRKAAALMAQAEKLHAKATKAVAAQNMVRRAEQMLAAVGSEEKVDRVADIRFPKPAHCGKTPIMGRNLSKTFGSTEVFTGVDLTIDRGSRVVVLGLNGAGKTTLLRIMSRNETPDTGEVIDGHGLKLGYFAQEHDGIDMERTVLDNMARCAPTEFDDTQVRKVLGSFLFSGDDVSKPARVLSGGEKTRLALAMLVVSSANVLLLDEPTNNLDPVSRGEVLEAIKSYQGSIVLVTHDPGAVEALSPDRVLLLPDGDEDMWSEADYGDLIELA